MEPLVPPGWAQRGDRFQSLHNTFTEQENFGVHAEIDYVPATCAEVECNGWRDGWNTALPAEHDLVEYIRRGSGRKFVEYSAAAWNERAAELVQARNAAKEPGQSLEEFTPLPLGMVVFVFEPGQPCFQAAEHRATRAVNPLFQVRDHWGQPLRRHSGVDPFLDDFRTHFERVTNDITS